MAAGKLVWDTVGNRYYETGVSKGVLFVWDSTNDKYKDGVAWSGLSAVTESPDGADENAIYADNIKYLSLRSVENFGGTIEAYTYPDEFAICDGSAELADGVHIGQQTRVPFCFCYQTKKGNDRNADAGYVIHIVYGCTASPTEKSFESVNDSSDANTFSWEFSTVPVDVAGYKPTSHIEIDSTKCDATKLATLEAKIYGSETTSSALLLPEEIMKMMAA